MSLDRGSVGFFYFVTTLLVGVLTGTGANAAVWYVDASNGGVEDGTSWGTAFSTIQPAIDAAAAGDEVWVASGLYDEVRVSVNADGSGIDTGSLVLKSGVEVYGGFVGSEVNRSERDWEANPTVIDGTVARSGTAAYHVVVTASDVTLDGFTITGGRANVSGSVLGLGGGIFNAAHGAIAIRNCTIEGNEAHTGGGMGSTNSSTACILIDNCRIRANTTIKFGPSSFSAHAGGIYFGSNGTPEHTIRDSIVEGNVSGDGGGISFGNFARAVVDRCVFRNNEALSDRGDGLGGGMFLHSKADVRIANTVFDTNLASNRGGAVSLGGDPGAETYFGVRNSTFYGNVAATGFAIDAIPLSNVAMGNAIFWANIGDGGGTLFSGDAPTIVYSNVQGGYPGPGNLSPAVDPLFVDPLNGDLRLASGSPCIDAGGWAKAPADDLDRQPRPLGNRVDMGAFESGAVPGTVWYVDVSEDGTGDGSSWDEAFTEIQNAIDAASAGDEVWVRAGTYSEPRSSLVDGVDTGSLQLKAGVHLYGGFAGTETSREGRDIAGNPTVIDGSTARSGSPAYHVVLGANDVRIEGFVISGGQADNTSGSGEAGIGGGAGIHNNGVLNMSVNACWIVDNSVSGNGRGAGINNVNSAFITVDDSVIANNDCNAGAGGGANSKESSVIGFRRSVFANNTATSGGGVFNERAEAYIEFTNCLFAGNVASNLGGAMHNQTSNPLILNSTVVNNSAGTSAAVVARDTSNVEVKNSVLWDNGLDILTQTSSQVLVNHSDIETGVGGSGIVDGGGNFSADPLFANAGAGDYHLTAGSPCVDAASCSGPDDDLDGHVRRPLLIDVGAYEFQWLVADAGADQTVECGSHSGAGVQLDGSGSTTQAGETILSYEWLLGGEVIATGVSPTVVLGLGVHEVTLRATDSLGSVDEDTVAVTVEDTTTPTLSLYASPHVLWPANHKLIDVHVTATVSDACDADPAVVLVEIINSESDDSSGGGDGNTDDDVQEADTGTEDYDVKLRAERRGKGDGRVYTLVYRATDGSGNSVDAEVTVEVPHDTSEHSCDQPDCDLNAQ